MTILGKIKCRFLNGSSELKNFFKLLDKTFHRQSFWFKLDNSRDIWELNPEDRQRMLNEQKFEVEVHFLLGNRKDVDIVLESHRFNAHPISGSPLKVRESAQADLVPEFAQFRC